MNLKQCSDWLRAFGLLRPEAKLKGLPLVGEGRWEIGLSSRGTFEGLAFRRFGDGADFPTLSFGWDLKAGRRVELRRWKGGVSEDSEGKRVLHHAGPASLASIFSDFAALCPVSAVVSEWDQGPGEKKSPREGWSLRLKRSVAWPFFIRTDMAAPFMGAATELAYLMLDRKVKEVAFDQDLMVVYFGA